MALRLAIANNHRYLDITHLMKGVAMAGITMSKPICQCAWNISQGCGQYSDSVGLSNWVWRMSKIGLWAGGFARGFKLEM